MVCDQRKRYVKDHLQATRHLRLSNMAATQGGRPALLPAHEPPANDPLRVFHPSTSTSTQHGPVSCLSTRHSRPPRPRTLPLCPEHAVSHGAGPVPWVGAALSAWNQTMHLRHPRSAPLPKHRRPLDAGLLPRLPNASWSLEGKSTALSRRRAAQHTLSETTRSE
ncbi:hypothetical protein BDW66DRAFT_16066 [Aspergillus desertorum]